VNGRRVITQFGIAARVLTGKGQYIETSMMNSNVYCNSDDALDHGRCLAHLGEWAHLLHRTDARIVNLDQVTISDELLVLNGFLRGLLSLAAAFIRNGIRGRPRQQDRIFREIDAIGEIGRVKDQLPFVLRARR
jgi:hypothetical protein